MPIQWYPGHMHKATQLIKKALSNIDILIEIIDARIPFSSSNPVIDRLSSDKPRIKLLNKSDLADPQISNLWLQHFNATKQVHASLICKDLPGPIRQLSTHIKQLLPNKAASSLPIHAMILGIPNVGKSTLINILADRTIAKTGNEPAVTKQQQLIKLENNIYLSDTPGILWPKIDNVHSSFRLAATGAIKDTAMDYTELALFTLDYLCQEYPQNLFNRYGVDTINCLSIDVLEAIGRKRGCLVSGGRVKLDQASKILISELRSGQLGCTSLETPKMIALEMIEVEQRIAEKAAKKAARKDKFKAQSRS